MHRTLAGLTMIFATASFAVAALAVGYSLRHPMWWNAAVQLAVLGGITLMIYAVNIKMVPVFALRMWRSTRLLVWQVGLGGAGAWLVFLGQGWGEGWIERGGHVLALAGGALFMLNIAQLFHQKPHLEGAPAPDPKQIPVDKIAIRFTRLSATYLLLGLLIGVVLSVWSFGFGRWDLVWAHTMLVGWFMSMASGVSYHVLSRWTGVPWRSVGAIRGHYRVVEAGLPFMLLALAADLDWLFLVAGPVQAVAMLIFLANIAQFLPRLTGAIRVAVMLAIVFLVAGVGLGIMFAVDVSYGPRLRQVHVMANLFGWAGLLISGFGYQFLPGFAERPLRWPAVQWPQVAVLALGIVYGMYAMWARMYRQGPGEAVEVATWLVAAGMLLFTAQVAATFFGPAPARTVAGSA